MAHQPSPLLGVHDLGLHGFALGLGFSYCQASSDSLVELADAAAVAGATGIRLAPDHGMFLTGLARNTAETLRTSAIALGFWTEPDDCRRMISLCAGARGCASAFYDTRALAERVRHIAPELLDGSFDLHLSGCAKGCAHPAASLLVFSGARAGCGLVVNGTASAMPSLYIGDAHIEEALAHFAVLVRENKKDGESVAECLIRLGGSRIANALKLDHT